MNLYTLEVFLIGGPVTTEFIKKNPIISRTIRIRGDQTLKDLHSAIFLAFDREEEHMYEFQFGGDGPNDPKARLYGFPAESTGLKRDASKTKLDALKLKTGEAFGYWFDFGADWWHQVNVISVDKKTPMGKHPRVIDRVGQSPPQYAEGLDEDDGSMIWTLKVELLDGAYAGEEECVRIIEIDSSVALEDLHLAIQDAVGFGNDHLYEFYVARTERSRDRQRFDDENGGICTTTLEDIFPLEEGKKLYYLFDYGDSWRFRISKTRKKPHPPLEGIVYPRVTKSTGGNPDQYPDREERRELNRCPSSEYAASEFESCVMNPDYTDLQGQYLAFIYHYTKLNGCPPAEADIHRYFRVLPPTAHQMIVRLERKGFITRVPGQARSIKVLVPFEQLPPLE